MASRQFVVIGFCFAVMFCAGRAAHAAPGGPPSFTLEFEDIFGPCGDQAQTDGPGTTTIQGVNFVTSDVKSFNLGKGGTNPVFLRTSFNSDWYAIFCYDAGTTITFPQPISALSFNAGTRDVYTGSSFKLFAGGTERATFSDAYPDLHPVSVNFATPVNSVNIKFVINSGPTGLLGIDTLTYTLVPEPGAAAIAMCGAAMWRRRRR